MNNATTKPAFDSSELRQNLSHFYDADHDLVYRLDAYDHKGSDPSIVNPLRDPEQGPGIWPMVDGVKVPFVNHELDGVDHWEDCARVDWCVELSVTCAPEYFSTFDEAAAWLCSQLESFDAAAD